MALRKQGKFWHGEDLVDLREEVRRYSTANGYVISRDYAPTCSCGGGAMAEAFGTGTFFIGTDEEESGAALVCGSCLAVGFVADSQSFVRPKVIEDKDWSECVCGKRDFHVLV